VPAVLGGVARAGSWNAARTFVLDVLTDCSRNLTREGAVSRVGQPGDLPREGRGDTGRDRHPDRLAYVVYVVHH